MLISSNGDKAFSSITLVVNLCNAPFYMNNFQAYMNHILVHELGHYVYYFKDTTHTVFDALCRKNKTNVCNGSAFVSDYAMTMMEEDYAESFAYRYLVINERQRNNYLLFQEFKQLKPTGISKKIDYFLASIKKS